MPATEARAQSHLTMIDALASDASRRHLLRQATRISLFMRHSANLLVSVIVVVFPPAESGGAGRVFAALLGIWSAYRLATRSTSRPLIVIDYATTIAVCLATPLLVSGPHFYLSNSASVAIAGTAVVSFTLSMPSRMSLVLTLGIAAAFAAGASAVVGWEHVADIFNLYYFALQWVTSAAVQLMVLRVADSVDAAREDRLAAELRQKVKAAVRDYDHEQTRLLHDTVASTLLMVGTGIPLSTDRVAEHARRDLNVLEQRPLAHTEHTDLVAALRHTASHINTPVHYAGNTARWLDGKTVSTVAAAAREALNNVDRHAGATAVTMTVDHGLVRIDDNGCGFDTTLESRGHGIRNSITARMLELGGSATLHSLPGQGTTVELRWNTESYPAAAASVDPERLIDRTRTGYGLALTVYAVANLLAMVSAAPRSVEHSRLQWVLAAMATAVTLSAVSSILGKARAPTRLGIAALFVVSLTQSVTLPVDLLGTGAQWTQGTIGWCVLPLLLGERVGYGVGVLIVSWTVPAIYALVRDPSAHTVINLGYGTGSILILQLCALLFDNLIRKAGAAASAETDTRVRLVAADRIADAVQAEYRRRYADLADAIRPLLLVLAEGGAADAATQRHAQIEYQRLRALFDQSAAFDHVLLRELRPIIDHAQDRGVDVTITIAGTLPSISEAAARQLTGPAAQTLAVAADAARITVTGQSDAVQLSALCRGVHDASIVTALRGYGDDQLDLTVIEDTVWVTVRHQLEGGASHYALAGHAN